MCGFAEVGAAGETEGFEGAGAEVPTHSWAMSVLTRVAISSGEEADPPVLVSSRTSSAELGRFLGSLASALVTRSRRFSGTPLRSGSSLSSRNISSSAEPVPNGGRPVTA